MKIWVDADACPVVIKDILFKAAQRTQTSLILVANQPLRTPPSRLITSIQVAAGFDLADHEIAQRSHSGDLIITSDIPLAAEIIQKGGYALSPRGELFTADNVRTRLNIRDFMDTLRASGVNTGGPPPISQSERQAFANHLDRILTQAQKTS